MNMMADTKKVSNFNRIIKDYELLQQLRHKVVLSDSIVTTVCDKLNLRECEDLVRHVKFNFSLVSIILRSKMSHEIATDIVNMEGAKKFVGTVFYTSFIVENFMRVLSNLIFQSEKLRHIVFIKIPSTFGLPQFCSAIRHNRSLTILHIEDSDIGDEGCIQICQALRRCSILALALINCKITSAGVQWISWLLKEQSMLRKMAKWKPRHTNDMLQDVKLHGVKKLNINDNPKIEDHGAKFLISTLFEDNWVNHVHLQNIGITDNSCVEILKLLQHNHMISIFDIERNSIKSSNMLSFINICLTSRNTKCVHNLTEFCSKNIKNVGGTNIILEEHSKNVTSNKMKSKLNQKAINDTITYKNYMTYEDSNPAEQYDKKKNSSLNGSNIIADSKVNQNVFFEKYDKKRNNPLPSGGSYNKRIEGNFLRNFESGTNVPHLGNKSEPNFYKIIHKNNLEVVIKGSKKTQGQRNDRTSKYAEKIKESMKKKKQSNSKKVMISSSGATPLKIKKKAFNKTKYMTKPSVQSCFSQLPDFEDNKKPTRNNINVTKVSEARSWNQFS